MADKAPDAGPNASLPRRDAKTYIAAIEEYERTYRTWNDYCDQVDKIYGEIERIANMGDDADLNIFWANVEVTKEAVYARPPKSLVAARFKKRDPLVGGAVEVLGRTLDSVIDLAKVHDVLLLARDDYVICSRGVPWVRFIPGSPAKVEVEHLDRKDFGHVVARKWAEVPAVWRIGYMTREEFVARFAESALEQGTDITHVEFKRHDAFAQGTGEQKVAVYEVWDRQENMVVWVTKGVKGLLDMSPPWLSLPGFFPCPRPAYGSLQRSTLLPIPDVARYQGQLKQINALTRRISELTNALRLRGLVPGGADDLSEAVKTAFESSDDRAMLVKVSGFAMHGNIALKDVVVWLPIDAVVNALQACVLLRRQLIDDIYQVIGLSDILRGTTDPRETATAQQGKLQWGSLRLKTKQNEMVRMARDLIEIIGEIIAEKFDPETIRVMSQTDLITEQQRAERMMMLQMQVQQLTMQAQQVASDPAVLALAASNPREAQRQIDQFMQQMQALQGQMAELQQEVSFEQVVELLRNELLRPFVIEIETNSTLLPDEEEEKARRVEYMNQINGVLRALVPAVQAVPQLGDFASESLRYFHRGFLAGRPMDDAIDRLADQMADFAKAAPPPGSPTPDQEALAEQRRAETQIEVGRFQMEQAKTRHDMLIEMIKVKIEAAEKGVTMPELGTPADYDPPEEDDDEEMRSREEG